MATVYLPVTARLNLTSEQRAKGISTELYNLVLPKVLHEPGRVTTQLLSCIQHPDTGQWACVGDTTLAIAVHPQRDLHALVALFPQLTQEERDSMIYYIATNDVVYFQYLIPPDAETLTQEEAEAAGWFGDVIV